MYTDVFKVELYCSQKVFRLLTIIDYKTRTDCISIVHICILNLYNLNTSVRAFVSTIPYF